jgi:hypothetical protein
MASDARIKRHIRRLWEMYEEFLSLLRRVLLWQRYKESTAAGSELTGRLWQEMMISSLRLE